MNVIFSALEWNLVISVFQNLSDTDLGILPIRKSPAETVQIPASVHYVSVMRVLLETMLRRKVKRGKMTHFDDS